MKASWEAPAPAQSDADPYHSQIGDAEYWERLYAATPAGVEPGAEVFDWLAGWFDVGCLLEALVARDCSRSVLHLGCGNSRLPEGMYDAGYTQQTCIDLSPSVVEQMRVRNACRPMQWIAADCTDLTAVLEDDSFDLVIDKGTFDAITCHDSHALMLIKFLKEAFRVTKPGGVYICISLHESKDVLKWLRRKAFGWRVRDVSLGRPKAHHTTAYICTKCRPTQLYLKERWPELLRHVEEHHDSDVEGEEQLTEDEEGETVDAEEVG